MVIYSIVNKINGKKYIGSAFNFIRRKNKHLSELRRGVHHSSILQNAWNKYGETNFEFIVLEEIDEKLILLQREQWWLDNENREYNICPIAGNCEGRKHTEEAKRKIGEYNKIKRSFSKETRKKISDSKKGIKRDSTTWSKKRILKKCYEYNENGEYIKEWVSAKEIALYYNISESTITNSIRNCGFIRHLKIRFTYDKHESVDPILNLKNKKILQYDLDMNLLSEWDSVNQATAFLNLKSPTSISNCLNGRSKTAANYFWKYKN